MPVSTVYFGILFFLCEYGKPVNAIVPLLGGKSQPTEIEVGSYEQVKEENGKNTLSSWQKIQRKIIFLILH